MEVKSKISETETAKRDRTRNRICGLAPILWTECECMRHGQFPSITAGERKPGFGKWGFAISFPFFLQLVNREYGAAKKKKSTVFSVIFGIKSARAILRQPSAIGHWEHFIPLAVDKQDRAFDES